MPAMKAPMTRRTLIEGSTLLAVAGFTGRVFAEARRPAPSPAIRLGIASYTFRNFDVDHLIACSRELRAPSLNLKDMHLPMVPADQVKPRAEAYRAAGLTLTAAGTIYFTRDDDDDIRAKFDYVRAAGIPVMVCMPDRRVLPRLEKFVRLYDIRLAIHNHGPEDKNFPSPLDVLDAVRQMDPRIGLCIDVGHTLRAGTDPVEAIRKAGPRLFDLHIKDLARANDKDSQVAVGDGIVPVRAIFQALIDQHYPGFVDLEYEIHPDDPMPGVIKSFAYMRGVLAGMASH